MQTLAQRLEVLPQVGSLVWIGESPATRKPIQERESTLLIAGFGLERDYHAKRRAGTKRQVTLIQEEHLIAVASLLHVAEVTPHQVRRNLVVRGINLLALKGRTFQVGECRLVYSGPCDPCSRMEETFGPGGLNAMRGHGGITAMVLEGGTIRRGDAVTAGAPLPSGG